MQEIPPENEVDEETASLFQIISEIPFMDFSRYLLQGKESNVDIVESPALGESLSSEDSNEENILTKKHTKRRWKKVQRVPFGKKKLFKLQPKESNVDTLETNVPLESPRESLGESLALENYNEEHKLAKDVTKKQTKKRWKKIRKMSMALKKNKPILLQGKESNVDTLETNVPLESPEKSLRESLGESLGKSIVSEQIDKEQK